MLSCDASDASPKADDALETKLLCNLNNLKIFYNLLMLNKQTNFFEAAFESIR